jgi:hypothetical protein
MHELKHEWVSVRLTSRLLWWAIVLPHRRFIPRLLAFCRALIEDAESKNPSIKAYHDAQREKPTQH